MSDEITTAELAEIVGPDAYVGGCAATFDALFPGSGIGDVLRDTWTQIAWGLPYVAAAWAGAETELDFYGLKCPTPTKESNLL